MGKLIPKILLAALAAAGLQALPSPTEELAKIQGSQAIRVDNRVLAKPLGKPITVLDVMKRLDVHFHQSYPEYQRNLEARHQFYQQGWKQVLDEMVNNALIIADAEEKKVAISDGEVRRELEEKFGPNVVANLDSLGMSFEEAMSMVKADMLAERMKGYMISSRAMVALSPEKIRLAYDEFQKQQGDSDEWEYQVLSIRHPSKEGAEELAGQAAVMIADGKGLAEAKAQLSELQEASGLEGSAVISLSDMETRSDKTLAASHREILSHLDNDSFSAPESQVSRVDGSTVMRLFYLKEHVVKHPPTFDQTQNQLKNQILQVAAVKEQQRYIKRLRTQYGVSDESIKAHIPSGFEPFALQGYRG